ncbi:MAG TPA: hypothetical protein VIG64_03070, partial [Actinomycetota bacterium]
MGWETANARVRTLVRIRRGGAIIALAASFVLGLMPGANAAVGDIVFVSDRDGQSEIYTMDPNGAVENRVTFTAAAEAGVSWSPDRTQIAFATNRDGNYEIYKMNVTGTGLTRLTSNNKATDIDPDWSP